MQRFLQWTSLLFLLFCSTTHVLFAQENESMDIRLEATAQVAGSIEVITIESMNLEEVKPENDIISIDPQNSPYAGKMIAIGGSNSDIRISYIQERELTQQNGSSTLIFNYQLAGNTEDDQSSSEFLDRENRDFELNDQGRFYLWIGGSVDISTASPGNYQGEFTLDIEYI